MNNPSPDFPTPEQLAQVRAFEAFPEQMPGRLFVHCPDAAKSCVSVSACQRLHSEIITGTADPEACARPCSKCATGAILWLGEVNPFKLTICPRCGGLGRKVGQQAAPWAACCVSCWNRTTENKKGYGARQSPILLPPVMAPWLIGHIENDDPVWSVWIGDTQSEAILRQLARDNKTKFHDQRPGITGFDAGGHPAYFCRKHRKTALRWDWNGSAPTVGRVRFYCPDCEPQARTLPLAPAMMPMQFMTVQEAAEVYAHATGKAYSAIICGNCSRAPLKIVRDSSGYMTASCPCCEAMATVSSRAYESDWRDKEPAQPPYFSIYRIKYSEIPLSGSGAAALQLEPPSPLTLERVPQLLFNRLRACILAALGEWDYLDGVALAIDRERGDGAELLALLARLRAAVLS
ncbi:hypothetical protein R4036_004572 [Salmonella enterica]|nr:hypothetical protein [Salmonella enterica]